MAAVGQKGTFGLAHIATSPRVYPRAVVSYPLSLSATALLPRISRDPNTGKGRTHHVRTGDTPPRRTPRVTRGGNLFTSPLARVLPNGKVFACTDAETISTRLGKPLLSPSHPSLPSLRSPNLGVS